MIDITVVLLVLATAMVLSEGALGGRKLQSGLRRVLAVWGVLGAMIMAHFAAARGSGAFVFALFWAGAFLSWFGVRSHVESSILLRMVYLLRGKEMTGEQLLANYESLYGARQRLEELLHSGLAEQRPEGVCLTPKGRRILAAVDWLR